MATDARALAGVIRGIGALATPGAAIGLVLSLVGLLCLGTAVGARLMNVV